MPRPRGAWASGCLPGNVAGPTMTVSPSPGASAVQLNGMDKAEVTISIIAVIMVAAIALSISRRNR